MNLDAIYLDGGWWRGDVFIFDVAATTGADSVIAIAIRFGFRGGRRRRRSDSLERPLSICRVEHYIIAYTTVEVYTSTIIY